MLPNTRYLFWCVELGWGEKVNSHFSIKAVVTLDEFQQGALHSCR